ncbi:MAG: redoxin domain-containing protein [Kiloniellaceae bacterium]|jgi:peroxiredoxin|nr:redoxin domain-containing protein [Kiloniellaceae bacterium]
MLKTRQAVPELSFPTIDGGTWSLSERKPETMSMVVAYRGLHCPMCRNYLQELNGKIGEFTARGVEVVAVSSDGKQRAEAAKIDWELENVPIAYGLTIDKARELGLSISTSRGKTSIGIDEPVQFNEPGLFLVKPDGTLYAAYIQTMPFARPPLDQLLKAIDFIKEKGYPARGEA